LQAILALEREIIPGILAPRLKNSFAVFRMEPGSNLRALLTGKTGTTPPLVDIEKLTFGISMENADRDFRKGVIALFALERAVSILLRSGHQKGHNSSNYFPSF
jgi:hypothetical protein